MLPAIKISERLLRLMKNLLHLFIFGIILFLSGLSVTAVFAADGANFSLKMVSSQAAPQNQSYYILQGQSGAKLENSIWVINSGTTAGTVRLYAVDMATGQTGGSVFLMYDDPREVTGSWITLAASELTLAAGESREVPFSVTIPADARAGQHLGGIVAETVALEEVVNVNNDAESASFQVKVQSRNAMAVQVNLPGAVMEQIDVMGIAAGGQGGYQTLAIGMSNSGNVMLKPTGRLLVSDDAGTQVQDLQFSMDTFLPETAVDFPLFVENQALPTGEYLADLTLQYGENQESTHQLSFTITEAQVDKAFEGREALEAPASAAAAEGMSGRDLLVSGLIIFNVALVLFLIGLALYRRRKQAALPQ
jgi:hypothetical protein